MEYKTDTHVISGLILLTSLTRRKKKVNNTPLPSQIWEKFFKLSEQKYIKISLMLSMSSLHGALK